MSTIAASSSPTPYVPVSVPVAVSQPSDGAQADGKTVSAGSDPFGPAVVVDLSPTAQHIIDQDKINRSGTIDEEVQIHQKQWTVWAKNQGKTDDEIKKGLTTLDHNIRESWAGNEANKKYEIEYQARLKTRQPSLEQTLSDSGGPQSLIDAVRDVTRVRYDVGASGVSEASYGTEQNRARVRLTHGEEYLQQAIARGKVSDARARAAAPGSASALSRHGIDGPAFTVTDSGAYKMTSFTLKNISGGYSLAFDADTAEYQVSRQGVDITAAVFAGKAFS